ncbi:MAG: hypothetical protein ACM31C_31435 [Acidobacteriota bacterium]
MNDLAGLGAALRGRGLTARALAAWAVPRVSALPRVVPALPRADTPAGALLELFVAGRELPLQAVPLLDDLSRADLIDVAGNHVRARVAIVPLGDALLVCDRLDAPADRELVCWPDDSSYHLALALPRGPHAAWLDLGCGSAFAPLLRPAVAHAIRGTDLNPRAVRYARLGAALSGISHLRAYEGDLGEGLPLAQRHANLVTCNAPIPGLDADPYRPMWLAGASDFVARLVDEMRGQILRDGTVVVHAAYDALAPVIRELPGERVVVTYTPPGVRPFCVAWWRPDAPARHVEVTRELTRERPHVTYADYQAIAND